jgi:hypothetical protein
MLIRSTRFILRDHSGSVVNSYIDYFQTEQLVCNNSSDEGVVDIKKLMKLLPGCDAVICFGGLSPRLKYIIDIAKSCGVRQFIHSVSIDFINDWNADDIDINSKTNIPEDGVGCLAEYVKFVGNHSCFNVITVKPRSIRGKSIDEKISINVHLNTKKINYEWVFPIRNPFREIAARSNMFDRSPMDWKKYENLSNVTYYSDMQNTICLSILDRLEQKPISIVWFLANRFKNFLRRHNTIHAFTLAALRPKLWYKTHGRMIIRVKDVFMMMVLFLLWPEQVYRFSTRKLLPKNGERNRKYSKEVLLPLEVDVSKSNGVEMMKEINIVMRGGSFDPNKIKDITEPIFLAGITTPIQRSRFRSLIIKYKKQVTYTTSFSVCARKLIEDGLPCIWMDIKEKDDKWDGRNLGTIEDKEYSRSRGGCIPAVKTLYPVLPSSDAWTPMGLGLVTIAALFPFAERINIYGWDFHLNSSPAGMGYWKLFFSTYNYKCEKRSRSHFETMLINLYCGYQLSRLSNVTIHSYLGQLQRHKKLINRIERVLFD